MLDPAGPRVVLRELLVGLGNDPAAAVVEDRPRAGRPLVNRENNGSYCASASTSALPNSSAASGPEPVMMLPSFSTGFPV